MTKRLNGAHHLTGEWGLPRHVVKFVHSGLLVVTTIHAMEIYVKLHSTVPMWLVKVEMGVIPL